MKWLRKIWMIQKQEGPKKRPMRVQSLIFDKGSFSKDKAAGWAQKHGYKAEVDETGGSYRMRQSDPKKMDHLRTIELTSGVKAVVGKMSPTSSMVHVPSAGSEKKVIKDVEHDPKNLKDLRDSFSKFLDEESIEGLPHDQILQKFTYKMKAKEAAKPVKKSTGRRVATVAVRHGDHLLMGKRRDNKKWTTPGGHVDPSEDMLSGAKRELAEETGIRDAEHMEELSDISKVSDDLQVQPFIVSYDARPSTSMMADPDGEVYRWQWVDISDGIPEHIQQNMHVPLDRNCLMKALGVGDSVQKDFPSAIQPTTLKPEVIPNDITQPKDPDTSASMYPELNNWEAQILKEAFGAGDNGEYGLGDLQSLVEGTDYEMTHNLVDQDYARELAMAKLEEDPYYYKKIMAEANGEDILKDIEETEENPFSNMGLNVDLGSGAAREDGYIGFDTYPYDHGTIIHDLGMGIPLPDESVAKLRLVNALQHMDDYAEDPSALLAEIQRVLMPGGSFTYEGPDDFAANQDWMNQAPGLVLVNHEDNDSYDGQIEKEAGGGVLRQEFTKVAIPDAATANDAEPRLGLPADELSTDAIIASHVLDYEFSDEGTSRAGNLLYGYPSQGALSKGGPGSGPAPGSKGSSKEKPKGPKLLREDKGFGAIFQKAFESMFKGGPGSGRHPEGGPKKPGGDHPKPGHEGGKPGHKPGGHEGHGGHGKGGHGLSLAHAIEGASEALSKTADKKSRQAKSRTKKSLDWGEYVYGGFKDEKPVRKTQGNRKTIDGHRDPSNQYRTMLPGQKAAPAKGQTTVLKADPYKQVVTGVVLAPQEIDSQEDWMSAEDIEQSAHLYLERSRIIGSNHEEPVKAFPVESYIAPQDFETDGQNGPQQVKKGSWVLSVKVVDPSEWQKVLDGEYTGFSVGGFGLREPIDADSLEGVRENQ